MFSFRSDKTGLFSGLVLLILVSGALISTVILLLVGVSNIWIKVILGSTWVLCIATVLTRVWIFRYQMTREERKAQEEAANQPTKEG